MSQVLGQTPRKQEIFKREKLVDPKLKIRERTVTVLDPYIDTGPDNIIFASNDLKIERSGYWKQLAHDAVGTDKAGRVIHGRTWVEKTLAWNETERLPLNIEMYSRDKTDDNYDGYLYIMRNASHPINTFKVGITKRDTQTRAKELSSATASVDKFLVAEQREVKDRVLAERLAHEALNDYRLNDGREFFKIDFKSLMKKINEIVEKVNA